MKHGFLSLCNAVLYSRLLVLWVLPGLPLSPFWCLLQCWECVLLWAAQCCWATFCRGWADLLLGLGLLLSLGGGAGRHGLHSCYEWTGPPAGTLVCRLGWGSLVWVSSRLLSLPFSCPLAEKANFSFFLPASLPPSFSSFLPPFFFSFFSFPVCAIGGSGL